MGQQRLACLQIAMIAHLISSQINHMSHKAHGISQTYRSLCKLCALCVSVINCHF